MIQRSVIALCLVATTATAELVLDGQPFPAENVEIIWEAPTNRWPTNLWVYKVIPQQFSTAAVSNLMALGGFREKDRTHIEGKRPFKDKRLLYFANKERTRHLGIFHPMGWLYYRDDKARNYGRELTKNVPDEARTLELALDWLNKLGVDRSELVTKEGSSELLAYRDVRNRGWYDKDKGEQVKEVSSRGISFVRCIDGISLTGLGTDGGFSISFVGSGKVAALELLWRNHKRHKLYRVVSPAELIKRIQQGEAKVVPTVRINTTGAKKLNIAKVSPYYLGEDGETAQNLVYPFAAVEGTLEGEDGVKRHIALKCPILLTEPK